MRSRKFLKAVWTCPKTCRIPSASVKSNNPSLEQHPRRSSSNNPLSSTPPKLYFPSFLPVSRTALLLLTSPLIWLRPSSSSPLETLRQTTVELPQESQPSETRPRPKTPTITKNAENSLCFLFPTEGGELSLMHYAAMLRNLFEAKPRSRRRGMVETL